MMIRINTYLIDSRPLIRVLLRHLECDGQPGHMVMLKAFESMAVKPSALAYNV
jgi:hypothetical protein